MQYLSCAQRGRNPDNPKERSRSHGLYRQRLEVNIKGMSNTITTVQKDYLLMEENKSKGKLITKEIAEQLKLPEEYIGKRFRIRKLTPTECFRLMGGGRRQHQETHGNEERERRAVYIQLPTLQNGRQQHCR